MAKGGTTKTTRKRNTPFGSSPVPPPGARREAGGHPCFRIRPTVGKSISGAWNFRLTFQAPLMP
eukprot:9495793-Pyramimonas_sp.AAC.1